MQSTFVSFSIPQSLIFQQFHFKLTFYLLLLISESRVRMILNSDLILIIKKIRESIFRESFDKSKNQI